MMKSIAVVVISGAVALSACSTTVNRAPGAAPAHGGHVDHPGPPGEHHAHQHAHGEGGHGMEGTMKDSCPMAVEGTTARAEDVGGGVALVFTTTGGDVAELRRRVAAMAQRHAEHGAHQASGRPEHDHGGGGPHGGMDGMGEMHGGGGPNDGHRMPPSDARSEDVQGGARIVYMPRDPAKLDDVRAHVRAHADKIRSGACPMMAAHEHEGS